MHVGVNSKVPSTTELNFYFKIPVLPEVRDLISVNSALYLLPPPSVAFWYYNFGKWSSSSVVSNCWDSPNPAQASAINPWTDLLSLSPDPVATLGMFHFLLCPSVASDDIAVSGVIATSCCSGCVRDHPSSPHSCLAHRNPWRDLGPCADRHLCYASSRLELQWETQGPCFLPFCSNFKILAGIPLCSLTLRAWPWAVVMQGPFPGVHPSIWLLLSFWLLSLSPWKPLPSQGPFLRS